MIMRKYSIFIPASILLILLASCSTPNQDNDYYDEDEYFSSQETNVKRYDEKYVGIYAMAGYDYFTDHKIGFTRAGEILNVETEYMGPADNDIEEMKECFKRAIAEEVSGIVVFGANDSLGEMIDKAAEVGIPTVTVDGDVKDSRRIAFVGTDNLSVGKVGGKEVVAQIGQSGNVAILTEPDVDLHRDRTAGYQQFFAQYDDINVVGIGDTKADPDNAYEAAAAADRR